MPCPENVNIPEIFKLWNQVKVLGLSKASETLRDMSAKNQEFDIGNCTKCGSCEKKCPNNLEIIKMLDVIKNEI